MNAKKCDRCGKFYEKYKGTNLIVIGEEGGHYYDYEEKSRYELCPDCMGQMIFHLKNGGPNECSAARVMDALKRLRPKQE